MDLSKYAALFLAESREHLSSCNQYLLEWERDPAAAEPVAGLFRAIHTIKGMAATMGYDAVSGLAHGTENLLDAVRAGRVPATPALIQLLFSSVDGITAAVGRAGAGLTTVAAEDAALMAELDAAVAAAAPAGATRASAVEAERVVPASRLVSVSIRPDAPVRGGRAMLALRKVEPLGGVSDIRPGIAMFERDDFDGRFTFRLAGDASVAAIEAAIRSAGDVESVTVTDGAAAAGEATAGLRRQIRIDLTRLDTHEPGG